MVVPEQSHLLFERAPGIRHPGEPPSLKLASIEPGKVERVRKIKTASKQIIHRPIVDLLIVDQEVDRAIPPPQRYVIDLTRAPAVAHPSEEMSGLIVCDTRHRLTLLRIGATTDQSLLCWRHPLVAREVIRYDLAQQKVHFPGCSSDSDCTAAKLHINTNLSE